MKRLLALAGLIAMAGCAPRHDAKMESCTGLQPIPGALNGARSFVYATRSGRPLRIYLFGSSRGSEHPGILFFFGGGWRVGSVSTFQPQAQDFARRGYVAAVADYRVKCRDGTTPLAATSDAAAAYLWLRAHSRSLGIRSEGIVLSGGSAGGQLAAATAMKASVESKPAALVLFNPAVDLVSPAAWYQKPFAHFVSPDSLSFADLPPTIIFHGTADRTVPIATSAAFCRKAVEAGRVCTLVRYVGQSHGFYHSNAIDPAIRRSDYADTVTRAEAFLAALGLERGR